MQYTPHGLRLDANKKLSCSRSCCFIAQEQTRGGFSKALNACDLESILNSLLCCTPRHLSNVAVPQGVSKHTEVINQGIPSLDAGLQLRSLSFFNASNRPIVAEQATRTKPTMTPGDGPSAPPARRSSWDGRYMISYERAFRCDGDVLRTVGDWTMLCTGQTLTRILLCPMSSPGWTVACRQAEEQPGCRTSSSCFRYVERLVKSPLSRKLATHRRER